MHKSSHRCRCFREILLSGAAAGVIALACSYSVAQAANITASGDVTPTPPSFGSWRLSGNLIVGNTSNGTLTVTSGENIQSNPGATANGIIGNQAGAVGTVTIDGVHPSDERISSDWSVGTAMLSVGKSGTGTLNIINGGTVSVTTGSAYIGENAGSHGIVNVDGRSAKTGINKSTFSIGSQLNVGKNGVGELNITNGGYVYSRDGSFIGNDTGSDGSTATIDGAGSLWELVPGSLGLIIGQGANGSLTVRNGGTLQASKLYIGYLKDGTVNVGAAIGSPAAGAGNLTVNTIQVGLFGNDTLTFNYTDTNYLLSAAISGRGTINQMTGVTTLTGDGSGFGGTTKVTGGVLQIGNGSTTGALNGTIVNDTKVIFNRSSALTFAGTLSSNGLMEKNSTGILTMTGNSAAFTGSSTVNDGGLFVGGTLGGTVLVKTGASLGGNGTIIGNTDIAAGATLIGQQNHTLTFNNNLVLSANSFVDVSLGAALNAGGLFNITKDLTLAGTLNVHDLGDFGPGLYRIFDYGGTLSGAGLTLGTVPAGTDKTAMVIQTDTANQVNLFYTGQIAYNSWDGGSAANHNNGHVDGGDGVWDIANDNWTTATGAQNGTWNDGDYAFFTGTSGTVTVDETAGAITTQGLVFSVNSYTIGGDGITLAGDKTPTIRVGDGTAAGAALSATVSSELRGTQGLEKVDFGTLVLTADNSYTGGTVIDEGVLQLGDGGTTGSIQGDVVIGKDAYDHGVLAFNLTGDKTFAGAVSGGGSVLQKGPGTIRLSGNNTFSGGLTIASGIVKAGITDNAFGSGRLAVKAGAQADLDNFNTTTGGLAAYDPSGVTGDGDILLGSAILTLDQSFDSRFSGIISGSGGVVKNGSGDLTLTGNNTYTGTTEVHAGLLQLGDGGQTGMIAGDIILSGGDTDSGNLIINLEGQQVLAGKISGDGTVLQKGTGTIIYNGDNSYAGGLTIEKGTAQAGSAGRAFGAGTLEIRAGARADLNSFDTIVEGLSGSDQDDGDIQLGSAMLTLNQKMTSEFSGIISGTGGLAKNGKGSFVLYGANRYEGATAINEGALIQGQQDSLSSASTYTVMPSAALLLEGFNTSVASLDNRGHVDFGNTGNTVLHVTGNYTGNGGVLAMNSVLAGDTSQTDLLQIDGDTSGTSIVQIYNRGGLGAQTVNGIKIIDIAGRSDGTFGLLGDYVTKDGQQAIMTGSAFAYTLQKNSKNDPDGGNWYLVSQYTKQTPPDPDPDCTVTNSCPPEPQPRYSAAAPVYESYTTALQALNSLPALQQRTGGRYHDDSRTDLRARADSRAIWGRVEGAHSRFEPDSTAGHLYQNLNSYILQAGIDGYLSETDEGKLIGGLTGQYGNARLRVSNIFGDGQISTQGWGLGGTLTWYGNNGFYADGQAQMSWYDSDLGIDAINPALSNKNKGSGYSLSLEAGRQIGLDEFWSLTPQAQLMWSSVGFNTFTDTYGARIQNRDGDSLITRIGLSANYAGNRKSADGLTISSTFYGIANLYQEFIGGQKITYSGTNLETENDRTWGGIGAGGTYAWADEKYTLYGEGSVNTSLTNFADSYTLKGTIGFKMKW